jgi:tetratricopeptide (TPR) repeat protein
MLETIREFAEERLDVSPEAPHVRSRHAAYFLEMAQRAVPNLFGADQGRWLGILAEEHDNFRAALAWAEEAGDAELALRLSASLWRFWQMRGHLREAAQRLKDVLALPGAEAHPEARAEALEGAGGVTYWMGDWEPAEGYYRECLDLRRGLGDPKGIADAAYNLSFMYTVPPEPLRDVSRARPLLNEALDGYRKLEDRRGIANVQWALSNTHLVSQDWREAADAAAEALSIFRELDDRFGAAWAAHSVGLNMIPMENLAASREHLRLAMEMFTEAGDMTGIGLVLNDFAILEASEQDFERALRLRAAAEMIERQAGQGLVTNMDTYYTWDPKLWDSDLSSEEEDRLRVEGEAFSTEEAIEYALGGKTAEAEVP